jgi:hypothetical protein
VPYQYYRAQKEFRQLTGWLRSKGVNFPRPLHTLREEFGSQICLHHGIHAASSALRHGALRVTTDHYVEAKVHATSGLGRLLGLAEAEIIMPIAEAEASGCLEKEARQSMDSAGGASGRLPSAHGSRPG